MIFTLVSVIARARADNFRGRYVDLRSLLTEEGINSQESAFISNEPRVQANNLFVIRLFVGSVSWDGLQDVRSLSMQA